VEQVADIAFLKVIKDDDTERDVLQLDLALEEALQAWREAFPCSIRQRDLEEAVGVSAFEELGEELLPALEELLKAFEEHLLHVGGKWLVELDQERAELAG